ncbi:phosphoribosyl-AMP cyclohydrolase [Maritalea porphyrae]|uniref:phosphoribosyl-AMP cyclohydrolase n=1 Tax=Maritalea porphyrae TaxID=880732 RepID=UPI0022B00DB2|nr:phosphoribosyl-AMP cyclohydrolase [Maritalea porphyrae]MCZ4272787.1 phosphoribosyl-AMP cyclohydrolase [Maritalea porphyrae]
MSDFIDPGSMTKTELEAGNVFAPRFDENGLILAITCDADSNELLMAAYMNKEAVKLTLETGFVHYYSRSRKSLWKKGESSGELQKFVEMRTDCDQDILQVLAIQTGTGAACHTGRKSCLYRKVVAKNGSLSLEDLGMSPLFDPDEKYSS